jgi:hypothetical protein
MENVVLEFTAERGVKNLLINCAHAKAGERLLIAYEPAELEYYDDDAVDCMMSIAKSMGLIVEAINVGFNECNPNLTPELLKKFESADIILFLARLGDQLRFSEMPQGKRIIVSFALSQKLFGSGFGNAHHGAFMKIKSSINTLLNGANEVQITCPAGTNVIGKPEMNLRAESDTSILRFPMSVFAPVPAHTFSGRVALVGFLTGTGSLYFENYHLNFDGQVFALFEQGRLIGFEGQDSDVAQANAYYDRVSARFGIDRNFVHSWHAGIHPGCGYYRDINENPQRWGGVAFGNPRLLHFHTCGAYAPGAISWNVVDPTITVDGVTVWDEGTFHLERAPGGAEILASYPCAASLFANPDKNIGIRNVVLRNDAINVM